ncbi:MAG: SpoIIIAH-like family protein [Oscillospiraceae bacterium]|nr:SpoIIIAH-like family protein [Oscillospiraceae bacterium]
MKVFKRNAVIITVLLFVAVAVYLNWSYNRGQDLTATNPVQTEQTEQNRQSDEDTLREDGENERQEGERKDDPASLYFREDMESGISAAALRYFDSARLTRAQARDSASTLLQEAAAMGAASQQEIDGAVNALTVMATHSLQEANLENLLMAKEFEQCVVFIREDGVSVIVNAPPEGLSQVAVARITEAVVSELGVRADQLTIIPVA